MRLQPEYSAGKSAAKGLRAGVETLVALVVTIALALAVDPALAAQLVAVFADHPGAAAAVALLVALGRGIDNYRKQHPPERRF